MKLRIFLGIVILGIVIYLLSIKFQKEIKYAFEEGNTEGYKNGFSNGQIVGREKFIQDVIQTNKDTILYGRIRIEPHIDEKRILNSLLLLENGDSKAFETEVYKINKLLYEQISSSSRISEEEKQQTDSIFYLINKKLISEVKKSYLLESQKMIKNEEIQLMYYSRAKFVSSAIAKNICAFSTLILKMSTGISLSPTETVTWKYTMSDPCNFLISRLVDPISNQLVEAGIIKDLMIIQTKIERGETRKLAELATVEKVYSVTKTISKGTEFADLLLFKIRSSGTLTVQFKTITKFGFDLRKKLTVLIDHKKREITVVVPKPQQLSTSVIPTFIDQEYDIIKDISVEDYTNLFSVVRKESVESAIKDNIETEAKRNAESIFKAIFAPFINLPEKNYKAKVIFG